MRIALMAPQGGGKTCYLTSLYGELTDLINYADYREALQYTFTDMEQNGFLEESLNLLLNGEMPEPTRNTENYDVTIRNRLDKTQTYIELVDFPGGFLKKIGENKDLIESTLSKLSSCDAFIILIDASHIEKNNLLLKREIAASKISELLLEVVERKRNTRYTLEGVPFIFAISKVDKVDKGALDRAYSIIVREDVFGQFFEHQDCIGILTQVSIGDNIDGLDNNKKKGEYNPKNIFLPFYLSLGIGTMSGARYSHKRTKSLEKTKHKLDAEKRQLKNKLDTAVDNFDDRRSKNIFHRAWIAVDTGVDLDDLNDIKRQKNIDHSDKEEDLDDTINHINYEETQLKTLRNMGALVLNKVIRKYGANVSDAIIIRNKKTLKLVDEISHSTENIFEEI